MGIWMDGRFKGAYDLGPDHVTRANNFSAVIIHSNTTSRRVPTPVAKISESFNLFHITCDYWNACVVFHYFLEIREPPLVPAVLLGVDSAQKVNVWTVKGFCITHLREMSCLRTLLARGSLHSPKRCLHPESRYSNGTGLCWTVNRRQYHDELYGFRKRREYVFPDCELGSLT